MVDSAATKSGGEVARQIARVAARLFAERGYEATSVREIVEAAGVTKPTLYYHFGSKEGLAQALLTVPMSEFVARLRACLDGGPDPVANLAAQFAAHLDFMADDPDRARFYHALHFGPHASSLAGELASFGRQMHEAIHEGVARVVASGLVDRERADRFETACRGTIILQSMEMLYPMAECGPRAETGSGPEWARTMLSDLLNGFAATPGPMARGEGVRR